MRKKREPLTADDVVKAKMFARWLGNRIPDPLHKQPRYTNKELGDLADLFLFDTRGWNLEACVLVRIIRRYWASKGAETKARKKRLRIRLAEREIKKKLELEKQEHLKRQKDLAARQGTFNF